MTVTAPRSSGLGRGIGLGLIAALVGAALWAVLITVTNYKIGFAAIGIGLLVGFATQRSRSIDSRLPIIAAALALLGCVLGDIFATAHDQARLGRADGYDVSTWAILKIFAEHPDALRQVYADYFKPMDLLFYAIAAYEGFKFALIGVEKSKAALTPPPAYEPPAAGTTPGWGAPVEEALGTAAVVATVEEVVDSEPEKA